MVGWEDGGRFRWEILVGDSSEMGETGGNTMGDGDADVARVGLDVWWECFGWEGGWAGEDDCSLEKDGWSSL